MKKKTAKAKMATKAEVKGAMKKFEKQDKKKDAAMIKKAMKGKKK